MLGIGQQPTCAMLAHGLLLSSVLPWLDVVKEIAPRQVMVYTIDRETPDHALQKATHEELDRIVALLEKAGIKASASY